MKRLVASVAFAGILLSASPAGAQTAGGFAALSLAELVGLLSPLVSPAHHAILAQFRNGNTNFASSNAPFTFTAPSIDCGASNVDITHYRCMLTFNGGTTSQLTGAAAQNLYATLIEAGVPSDGAAGTIHEAVLNLSCTVHVGQVKDRAGGGATCNFTPN